jgi:hypothetical protein
MRPRKLTMMFRAGITPKKRSAWLAPFASPIATSIRHRSITCSFVLWAPPSSRLGLEGSCFESGACSDAEVFEYCAVMVSAAIALADPNRHRPCNDRRSGYLCRNRRRWKPSVLRNLIRTNSFTTEETRRAFSSRYSPVLTDRDLVMVNPSATNCPGDHAFARSRRPLFPPSALASLESFCR